MSTFTWSPRAGAAAQVKPRVRTAQFGDGYAQRIADGINANPRVWSVEFTAPAAKIDQIEAFLVSHAGVASFQWLPPSGSQGKWLCAEWSRTAVYALVHTLNASFQEVFGD